jgi:hypothetical protein
MQPHNHSNDYSDYTPCPIDTCFGCVNGYCTIIFGDAGNGCFYKERTEALWQIRHCFYQLISQERFDLLYRYADTYAELGLMDKEINEIYQKQAELDAFRTSDISETDDTDWIPPYTEWFCDHDIIEDADSTVKETTDSETQAASEQDKEKTSADYRSFNSLPISAAAYDLREISSREDTEDTSDEDDNDEEENDDNQSDDSEESDDKKHRIKPKTEYKSWISEERFRRAMLELYYCYFKEPYHKNVPLSQRAREMLGASIVYDAYTTYITVLRKLWSRAYCGIHLHRLIVRKWECETFFGSRAYWLYTNINPERIMDRAHLRAMRECKAAIRRHDLKIKAGMIEK